MDLRVGTNQVGEIALMNMTHKRGDTFICQVAVTQDSTPKDLSGWTVRSQVRDNDTLVADLEFSWVDQTAGTYQLRLDDTTAWPTKLLQCDIEYTTDAAQVVSTETFGITCIRDVTQ